MPLLACHPVLLAGVAYALLKEAAKHYGLALNCGRPLVILMGGPSGHGKTLMAKQLAGGWVALNGTA